MPSSSLADVLLVTFAVSGGRMRLVETRRVAPAGAPAAPASSSRAGQIHGLREYLDQTFPQPHSLRALAERTRLDPSHLCRVFKQHTGRTITQYLRDRRIQAAMTLLRESDEQITDIAACIGFRDLSHFNRSFKVVAGMSPRDYRKGGSVTSAASGR